MKELCGIFFKQFTFILQGSTPWSSQQQGFASVARDPATLKPECEPCTVAHVLLAQYLLVMPC